MTPMNDDVAVSRSSISPTMIASLPTVVAAVKEVTTIEMEEEEGGKRKVKEFPFSEQVGFVLERKNKFSFGRK